MIEAILIAVLVSFAFAGGFTTGIWYARWKARVDVDDFLACLDREVAESMEKRGGQWWISRERLNLMS